jgi:phosphoribosyl 1,2-cyclic phosphodiesterase
MRVISLGSGSSGNSLLIEAGPERRTKLLVDAGFRDSTLIARLRHVGITPGQLSGILVTHEHSDHILSLPALMKRYAVPVIADVRTLEAIEQFVTSTWQGEFPPIDRYPEKLLPSKMVMEEQQMQQVATRALTSRYMPPAHSDIVTAGAGTSAVNAIKRPLPLGTRTVIGDIEVTSFPVSHDAVALVGIF